VTTLAQEGLDFEVAVAGQAFRETADSMQLAAAALGDRLVHVGEPETRQEYAALLAGSDIAVSTAINEFFGLAMIECLLRGLHARCARPIGVSGRVSARIPLSQRR